jgi:hypothetical protein
MSYISGHAGAGSPLQFASAAADDVEGERVEPKYCDRCRRMYFRKAVPVQRLAPPAICPQCVKLQAEQAARELSELDAVRRQVVRTPAVH